jgi:DNA mismatch repair protein MutS
MKSIGLATIMASAGMFVPATSFEFYPFEYIFTRIPCGDNIMKGQSTFTNEIAELRNIIKRADGRSLVIGDELCSGTESVSAMSIVAAGIIELTKRDTCFIFASHLHDIVNIAKVKALVPNDLRVCHLSVEYDEATKKLIYDRQLKEGQGRTLYGLEVCKALDLPDDFMSCANEIRQELLDIEKGLLSGKKSRYNSLLYKDGCKICGAKSDIEVHHIQEQFKADAKGYVNGIHKNTLFNLVCVCGSCHDKIHNGKLSIAGYVRTTNGTELVVSST